MSNAIHAEWTKLRTDPGTGWLLLTFAVLTVGLSAAAAAAVTGTVTDVPKLSLVGVQLGQAVVAILGVLVICGEYSTGMIRLTLTAVPRRTAVLVGKAASLSVIVLPVAVVAVAGSLIAAKAMLPDLASLDLSSGTTWRAAFGSVLYLVLIGLLSLGIATCVRDSAVAIGVILSLLYLFPILVHVVTDHSWQRHLQQIAPMNAGLTIQNTAHRSGLPIGPWAGLGVLALWALGSLLLGGVVLRLRDA